MGEIKRTPVQRPLPVRCPCGATVQPGAVHVCSEDQAAGR